MERLMNIWIDRQINGSTNNECFVNVCFVNECFINKCFVLFLVVFVKGST